MYKRAIDKREKQDKIEKEKVAKANSELKEYFRPKILSSTKSWENLKKNEVRINQKIVKADLRRQQRTVRNAVESAERFEKDNKGTVYYRMQEDLEQRKDRERKRNKLKKFKDLHYKEYCQVMEDDSSDQEQGNSFFKVFMNLLTFWLIFNNALQNTEITVSIIIKVTLLATSIITIMTDN